MLHVQNEWIGTKWCLDVCDTFQASSTPKTRQHIADGKNDGRNLTKETTEEIVHKP